MRIRIDGYTTSNGSYRSQYNCIDLDDAKLKVAKKEWSGYYYKFKERRSCKNSHGVD
jgi:hypothetical protein